MGRGVTILLYAQARVAVGHHRMVRPIAPEGVPLAALLRGLVEEFPDLGPILPSCRYVRNGEFTGRRAVRLKPGDELGIHPPYSGG